MNDRSFRSIAMFLGITIRTGALIAPPFLSIRTKLKNHMKKQYSGTPMLSIVVGCTLLLAGCNGNKGATVTEESMGAVSES